VLPEVLIVGSGQMASSATERLNELGLPFRVAARDESYAARIAGPATSARWIRWWGESSVQTS